MKKATKKETAKTYPADDVKRYLGSLSEQHRHEIKAVSEQFGGIMRKLDSHEETSKAHGATIKTVNEQLSSLTATVNSHTEMLGQVMTDIQEIKSSLTAKVDRAEFSRLERRVIALERARAK